MKTKEEILQSNGVYYTDELSEQTHNAILKSMDDYAAPLLTVLENISKGQDGELMSTFIRRVMRISNEAIKDYKHLK